MGALSGADAERAGVPVTLSTACPKPAPAPPKIRKYLPRSQKPLKRSWLKRGTKPIPAVNQKRMARRKASYAKVLRSDFHKRLRYTAWSRSGGLCECEQCADIRRNLLTSRSFARTPTVEEVGTAFMQIPIWFTKAGKEAHQRFRTTDGECHHDSYRYYGQENPEELHYVRFVWKNCHKRIEAEKGTRNRYLRGLKK